MRTALVLALMAAAPALAAEVAPRSAIDAVVVYPDGAIVARIAEIELPAGASTVLIKDLPASIDPASIRVEGLVSAPLTMGAVDVRSVPGEARPVVDQALEGKLVALRDERGSVEGAIQAAAAKKEMIERYSRASPEKLGAEQQAMPTDDWPKAWEAVGTSLAQVNEDLRKLRVRARDLDGEIRALENARPRPPAPGLPRREVSVAVEAREALKGRLKITYRIGGAQWIAAYDARLSTGSATEPPRLDLVRRAIVAQNTGEDWNDVEIAVSTARTAGNAAAPVVPPLQVGFLEVPVAVPMGRMVQPAPPIAAAPAPADAARPRPDYGAGFARPKEMVAAEQGATVDATAYEATFRIPGRVTIVSGGGQKTLLIGLRSMEAKITAKAAPGLDQTAYLSLALTNDDEAAMLPGEVALQRDGAFVGRTRVGLIAPGEDFELGFGADERIRVKRQPIARRETDPATFGSTRTDTRDFRTVVENLHERVVKVTIVDQIPYSEIGSLTVDLLTNTTTAPTVKDLDGKRGVLAWTYDLKPKEKKEIRLTYRIRYPVDRVLTFTPQR